jgi:hypothetical protein
MPTTPRLLLVMSEISGAQADWVSQQRTIDGAGSSHTLVGLTVHVLRVLARDRLARVSRSNAARVHTTHICRNTGHLSLTNAPGCVCKMGICRSRCRRGHPPWRACRAAGRALAVGPPAAGQGAASRRPGRRRRHGRCEPACRDIRHRQQRVQQRRPAAALAAAPRHCCGGGRHSCGATQVGGSVGRQRGRSRGGVGQAFWGHPAAPGKGPGSCRGVPERVRQCRISGRRGGCRAWRRHGAAVGAGCAGGAG